MIVGLVLAGGASRRLGRDKRLLPYGGGTVLSVTVGRLLASPLDRVIVVLGHDEAVVRRAAGLAEDARLVLASNPEWEEGLASSLRRGLEVGLSLDADAVVVALGDQPEVEPEVVARLVAARHAGALLAVPVRDGVPGHPVLFGHELAHELRGLRGDRGAREVLQRHWPQAVRIEAPVLPDLDTDDDYRALLDREGRPPTRPLG